MSLVGLPGQKRPDPGHFAYTLFYPHFTPLLLSFSFHLKSFYLFHKIKTPLKIKSCEFFNVPHPGHYLGQLVKPGTIPGGPGRLATLVIGVIEYIFEY